MMIEFVMLCNVMLMLRCDLLCYIAMPAALCYNFIYVVLSCVISLSICYVYIYIPDTFC